MGKNLLIATLGTSPAVVTEAIDLLAEERVQVHGVQLLVTGDPLVREGLELLSAHLPAHDKIAWIDPVPIPECDDLRSPEAAVEFMEVACRLLKGARDAGHRVFVSIAGGRKAMSALVALAVQFYGAERLFHVWVPPWIEEQGGIEHLRTIKDFPEEITRCLHPFLQAEDDDRPQMVDLPFVG